MRPLRVRLYLKVALFLLVAPGSVVVYIPGAVLRRSGYTGFPAVSPVSLLSILFWVIGAAILLLCVRDFAVHGEGTPAPVDPPRVLVVRGLYRYTRNPMYGGILLMLCAEASFFASSALLVYALIVFLFFHLFVCGYEERALRRKFGNAYERYCRSIPRWGIAFRAYR
ncbi:MAG TPA: isoprenylcysteine carboxylmethyltransferase family protein [Bacteroidota bacterium]|nr:isoprenylcysteine carboxylmethyltransferase family protein [Bacteroidota bacterium]